MAPRQFAILLTIVLGINLARLWSKYKRREPASYDGNESLVTKQDVLVASLVLAAAAAVCLYEWSR